MRHSLFFAGCVAAVLFAGPALAGNPQAQALFDEGKAAQKAEDWETARTKFAESNKLEPAGGTLLNLGECEEKLGHLGAAESAYREAAGIFANNTKTAFANEKAAAVAARVPRLLVHETTPTSGLVVHGGDKVLPLDEEVKLDPGELTLRAEAPGRKPKELKVRLTEGARSEVDVGALEADAPAPIAPRHMEETNPERSKLPTIGVIVGVAGVASLAVGAVTGLMALNRASTVKDHCDDALACDREGVDAASSGRTFSTVSTITVIAGGALLVGGGVLYFLGRRAQTGYVVPSATPQFAGVLAGASF